MHRCSGTAGLCGKTEATWGLATWERFLARQPAKPQGASAMEEMTRVLFRAHCPFQFRQNHKGQKTPGWCQGPLDGGGVLMGHV